MNEYDANVLRARAQFLDLRNRYIEPDDWCPPAIDDDVARVREATLQRLAAMAKTPRTYCGACQLTHRPGEHVR